MLGLSNQRDILRDKLAWNTGILSIELTEIYARHAWLILSEEHLALFRRLGVISRLLDNLLDDEWVEVYELIQELKEPNELIEVEEFRSQIPPELDPVFVENGILWLKIMDRYNRNPSHHLRMLEAKVLSRIYGALFRSPDSEIQKSFQDGLFHLMVAGYMFCDLKHLHKDKQHPNPVKSIGYLGYHMAQLLRQLDDPIAFLKDLRGITKKSIAVEFQKK